MRGLIKVRYHEKCTFFEICNIFKKIEAKMGKREERERETVRFSFPPAHPQRKIYAKKAGRFLYLFVGRKFLKP